MISRDLEGKLRSSSRDYSVVTLTGPRQSAKTTLVRNVFPEYHYVNLEGPDIRRLAEEDPVPFLPAMIPP